MYSPLDLVGWVAGVRTLTEPEHTEYGVWSYGVYGALLLGRTERKRKKRVGEKARCVRD